MLARHLLIAHTVQVWLHVSRNMSSVSIAQVSKMQTNPGIAFRLWSVRFFPLVVFSTISQTSATEALAISMEAPMGNSKDAAEEHQLRRKGDNAKVQAPRRRPSSWRRRKRRPWESIWGCSAVNEALSNQSLGKPVQFPETQGLDIPFSFLYTAQTREEHAYCGSQGPICLFDPCRLGLFLAYSAKGSNKSNFPWIRLPGWPRWQTASYLCGARVWNISCGFILYHRKEFQYFRCLQSSRVLGMSSENSVRLSAACGAGLLVEMCARRAATGGCGSSLARGSSETCSPLSSSNGTSTSLPKRWCCAACERCRGSADCRCGSRQKMSILSVSHVLGRGHLEREFHKKIIPNCMEPCVVSWSLFIKSGRRLSSGQSWKCRLKRQYAMGTFSWPTIGKPTRRGAWIGRNYSCISRHNCCKTSTLGHSGLGFRKEMFAHSSSPSRFWVFLTGYVLVAKGVGDVRPACLFPLVKSKCLLDSGVRRCCKAGHSCMRRVIDRFSVP